MVVNRSSDGQRHSGHSQDKRNADYLNPQGNKAQLETMRNLGQTHRNARSGGELKREEVVKIKEEMMRQNVKVRQNHTAV